MIDNQLGFTIKDLTYILFHKQLVLVINEHGLQLYDGTWSECNCIGDYEVISMGLVASKHYEDYIYIQIKKEVVSNAN